MITAEEARNLSVRTYDTHMEYIEKCIKSFAASGLTSVKITSKPYNLWLCNEDSLDKESDAYKVVLKLREAGYKVTFDSGVCYIGCGMVISWDNSTDKGI